MKTLISMTDYVLQFKKPAGYFEDKNDFLNSQVDYMGKVMRYAEFLKQPLTLGMFVPCDENGNVLEGFMDYDVWIKMNNPKPEIMPFHKREEYLKAKEKVLFKGFSLDIREISNGRKLIYLLHSKHRILNVENIKFYIVENVTYWEEGFGFEFELTENALKQIGL